MSTKNIKDFEKNLQTLEELVDALETGDLSLEQSLIQFEKGIKMTRECQKALAAAEQRVHTLLADSDELEDIDTNSE